MARPRRISDEQILSATRRCVVAHGARVSLDVIAAELGVTSPALLKRFGTREAVLLNALRPASHAAWIDLLVEGPTVEPLEAQLRRLFAQMYDFLKEAIPCMSALRESGIDLERFGKPEVPVKGIKALQAWLAAASERGMISACETEPAAYAILGALQSRAFIAHITQRPETVRSERKYIEDLARFFTRALVAAEAAPPLPRKTSSPRR